MNTAADVVIVGAGPAGTLAAIRLARRGVRVVLLDRDAFPRHKLCGDTINPGGLALLRAAGLADPVEAHGLALDGMLVTSASGVRIRGAYGHGCVGRAWPRRLLDAHLLEAAAAAGADVRTRVRVCAPSVDATGRVDGVRTRTPLGCDETLRARWTIAADGRRSTVALALGLIRHPGWPRRWAIGTYAEGVGEVGPWGEMHVRGGHYIGVAPAGDGVANLCVVTADRRLLREPTEALWSVIRRDPLLQARSVNARQVAPVVVLGPLAVDARACGAPGVLLAGDACGFVDPMTGDGLHLALRGGDLAAAAIHDGWLAPDRLVIDGLRAARRDAFGAKLRFNRALRALVGWPMGVRIGAVGATVAPALLRRIIATAGDVDDWTGVAA